MSNQPTLPPRSDWPGLRARIPFRGRVAHGIQALRLAGAVFASSAQFIPLGDNGELLGRLAARVRAARDCGA